MLRVLWQYGLVIRAMRSKPSGGEDNWFDLIRVHSYEQLDIRTASRLGKVIVTKMWLYRGRIPKQRVGFYFSISLYYLEFTRVRRKISLLVLSEFKGIDQLLFTIK